MKRTIRHLLAFTALAAIAALADVAVKQSELNEIPGNVNIATNMSEVVADINQRIAQGGGSSAEIYAAALAGTNYVDSATNHMAALYLPKDGTGVITGMLQFQRDFTENIIRFYSSGDWLFFEIGGNGSLPTFKHNGDGTGSAIPDEQPPWELTLPPLSGSLVVDSQMASVALAATNYTDSAISATNPAFAEAVKATQLSGASESDLAEIAEYGSYGTVGAAILALIAGLAALKRRMDSAETAIADKANAVDLRYALVTPTVVVERRTLPANCFPVSFSYNGVSYSVDALVDESEASAAGDMFLSAFDDVYSLGMVVAPASGDEKMELVEVATFRADGIYETGVEGLQFGGAPAVADTSPTLAAELSVVLTDRASNAVVVGGATTTATLTLPATVPGRMRDLIVDVNNSANSSDLGIALASDATAYIDAGGARYVLGVAEGDGLAELTSIDAGKLARFHFTETALVSGGLPVIFVQRLTLGAVARTITRS